jgi:aldose 1-epimerase
MRNPTGQQFELSLGTARAVITQVAASIREFSIDGQQLTEPYGADVRPPFGTGIVLVPWPNRIEDGIWIHDGEEQLLDLTEPELHNALHGLLRDRPYDLVSQTAGSVTLAATVFPTRGYLFELDTTVRYELLPNELRVTHVIRNAGLEAAPVAVGTHPFFRIGDIPTEELTLTVPAGTRFETDARLNPVSGGPVDGSPVAGTRFDLRAGRRIADLDLDDAFGDVQVEGGEIRSRLTAPDGRWVELWQQPQFPYIQVFTTRIYPRDGGAPTSTAVAVEPMTAPPNAFNSGTGLRWLQPGETWSLSWGIRYSGSR